MRLVPDERSYDVVFKGHLFFVPTLTRNMFLLHMREPKSDVNKGAEKVMYKSRQQVLAEYPKKLYQSLLRRTEAGILAGKGHRKYSEKKLTIKLTFSVYR